MEHNQDAERYYAHISEDGRCQSIEAHLNGTAERCAAFADAFGSREQGRLIGTLHDIGKYADDFQRRLDGASVKVDHSTAGAVECARIGADWGGICIAGHHAGIPDLGSSVDQSGDATYFGRLKKGLETAYQNAYHKNWHDQPASVSVPAHYGADPFRDSFYIRMLYSCLVDADFLDTEAFMSDSQIVRGGYDSLSTLAARLETYIEPWKNPTTALNRKRCEILHQCIDGAEGEKGLYTLRVPTGGGKTVASMAFALRHALKHGMSRIIYVIPYTSIIEQNADVFRTIFGAGNVLEHHSDVLFDESETDQRLAKATENWDAPIIVTTAVRFFESMYANRSSQCRKLHNIVNSVIVFDEAQMLPSVHQIPCVAAIAELVNHFGVTAVLCTATQPDLGDLFEKFGDGLTAKELCGNAHELYESFRRVTFRHVGKLSVPALAEELRAHRQVLCIVNTRKEAQELYGMLPEDGSYHLSTLMYPAHRRRTLDQIRKRLAEGLECRVVSTSLIEAGVDVDFPTVYRELAGLDSVLQAAGRCNREGKRPACDSVVTVFEGEAAPPPLLRVNIGAAREVMTSGTDLSDPDTMERYFAAFRSLAGDKLDKCGVISAFRDGIAGCAMPFKTVAERFHLIDDATKNVYVLTEESEDVIEVIRSGQASRELYRRASQYSVNIYERHYKALLEAGDIEPLSAECAVMINRSLYDENTGLSLDADFGKGLFI